jgi:hypothetical protein
MPTESETAYPRFKSTVTDRELREVYTPTPDEYELARQYTTGTIAQVALLILLKTFQRLGYAVSLTAVPVGVITFFRTLFPAKLGGLTAPMPHHAAKRPSLSPF